MATIEIEVDVVEKKKVEVEVPFYYKHDLSDDQSTTTIYGKITDTEVVTINRDVQYIRDTVRWEIRRESRPHLQGYNSYLTEEKYRSSREEWEAVWEEMRGWLQSLEGINAND